MLTLIYTLAVMGMVGALKVEPSILGWIAIIINWGVLANLDGLRVNNFYTEKDSYE